MLLKRLLVAASLLLLPSVVFAQGARYDNVVISGRGVLAGQNIAVCSQPANTNVQPCTPAQNIYNDKALTQLLTQPIQSDLNGNFHFYVTPGVYTIQIYGPQLANQLVLADQAIGNTATSNATNLVGPGTVTGNYTHSGTETFTGNVAAKQINGVIYIDGTTYACSAAGIQAAVTAAGAGGTVHAEGCTSGFVSLATVTITTPLVLYLPCVNASSAIYVNVAPFIFAQSNGIKIYGCDSGAQGTTTDGSSFGVGSPGTYIQACTGNSAPVAGCTGALPNSSAGDIFVAQSQSRSTQALARISSVYIYNIYIEMNGVGRRGIYLSSCWHCRLDHIGVDKGNGDGDIYIEADPAADATLFAASYNVQLNDISTGIVAGNTTTHPYYFDASNGELAYMLATNLRAGGAPNSTGAGSDTYYVNTGAGSLNDSFDQNVFITVEGFNPVANAYGFKMQCRGNYFGATGGRCFNNTFTNVQVERLFGQSASGTGIGCVNAAGTADGTGCGFLTFVNSTPFNFTTLEDDANLGGHLVVQNKNISDSGQDAVLNMQGTMITKAGGAVDASYFKYNPSSFSANAASQNFHGMIWDMSVATSTGGSTPNAITGAQCKVSTLGGLALSACLWDASAAVGSISVQGNSANWNGGFRFQEDASSPAGGPLAGFDYLYADSTSHTLKASYNNGTFLNIPQVIASGTSTLNSGSLTTNTCQATVTSTATGAATTDAIEWSFATVPASADALTIVSATPTSGNVNFVRCNPTSASQTTTAIVINWRVIR